MSFIKIVAFLAYMVGSWLVFRKIGKEGWKGIIPFYREYVLFEALYGNGWRFFMLFIPFYNIYVLIRLNIDLAHSFGRISGFGIGLTFIPPVFYCILGFGSSEYLDGSRALTADDILTRFISFIRNLFTGNFADASSKNAQRTMELLSELDGLRRSGVITEEEFQAKKAELLSRI